MSKKSTSKDSQTDWEALEKMDDEEIDLSEIPEVRAEQIAQATLRVGGKPVPRGKVRVNIYLDTEVVEYFKAKAGGRGYQTLINEALKESIRAKGIETLLRRVIREEMKTAR
ncbi:MAG: hypothetical protein D6796_11430 [Caldilineae bacterium]|nr:MAG: hypothetical protein D6796_11430 [Caldilineae bacterium]